MLREMLWVEVEQAMCCMSSEDQQIVDNNGLEQALPLQNALYAAFASFLDLLHCFVSLEVVAQNASQTST